MLPLIRACPLVLLAACHTVPSQASEPSPTTEGPIVKFYDVHDLVILEGSRANKLLVPEASVIERPIRRPLRVPGDALAAAAQTVLQDSFAWDETCSIACTDGLLTLLGPATAHDLMAAFLAGARCVDDEAHLVAARADAVPGEKPARSTDWHARLLSSEQAVLVLQRETAEGYSRFRVLHPGVFAPLLADAAPFSGLPLTISTDLRGWAIADGEHCRVEFRTLKDAAGGCLVSFRPEGRERQRWMTMSEAHWRALYQAVLDAPWEDSDAVASRYGIDVE